MEQTVTEEHADESGFSVEGEAIDLATHGADQEPPVFEETNNQRRCPGCRHPVAVTDSQRAGSMFQRCARIVCFRQCCETEFCSQCGAIATSTRHVRCICMK